MYDTGEAAPLPDQENLRFEEINGQSFQRFAANQRKIRYFWRGDNLKDRLELC